MKASEIRTGIVVQACADILYRDPRTKMNPAFPYDGKHMLVCVEAGIDTSLWVTTTSKSRSVYFLLNNTDRQGSWNDTQSYLVPFCHEISNDALVEAANAHIPNYEIRKSVDEAAIAQFQTQMHECMRRERTVRVEVRRSWKRKPVMGFRRAFIRSVPDLLR